MALNRQSSGRSQRRQHRSAASTAATSNGGGGVRRIFSEWVFRSGGGTKVCVFGAKGEDGFGFGTGSFVRVLFCTCCQTRRELISGAGRSATINMVGMNSKEIRFCLAPQIIPLCVLKGLFSKKENDLAPPTTVWGRVSGELFRERNCTQMEELLKFCAKMKIKATRRVELKI